MFHTKSAGKLLKRVLAFAVAFAICCTVFITPQFHSANTISTKADDLDDSISEYQSQLDSLKEQEAELDQKIADTQDSIDQEQANQDYINQRIEVTKQTLQTLNQSILTMEDDMADLNDKIVQTNEEVDAQKEIIQNKLNQFSARLRTMYISGADSYADILLGSDDFYDMLMRIELVKRVTEHDSDMINELIDLKKQHEAKLALQDSQMDDLKEKMQTYNTQLTEAKNSQQELQDLYLQSQESLEALQNTQGELNEQQENLDDQQDDVSGTLADLQARQEAAEAAAEAAAEEAARQAREDAAENNSGSDSDSDSNSGDDDYDDDYSDEVYTGDVSTVVDYAKSMVGGEYVFGGASHDAADCSGLTMLCYSLIGISLPHSAMRQSQYGTSVSFNDMQPGDLIFYADGYDWTSVYHVAMYVGNGKIVHASDYGIGIIMANATSNSGDIFSIRRLV